MHILKIIELKVSLSSVKEYHISYSNAEKMVIPPSLRRITDIFI